MRVVAATENTPTHTPKKQNIDLQGILVAEEKKGEDATFSV